MTAAAWFAIVFASRFAVAALFTGSLAVVLIPALAGIAVLALVIALCLRSTTGRLHLGVSSLIAVLAGAFWCCWLAFSPGGMDERTQQLVSGSAAAPMLPAVLAAVASLIAVPGVGWRITGIIGLVGLLAGPGIPAVRAVAAGAVAQRAQRSASEQLVKTRIDEAVVPFLPSDDAPTSFYVDETQARYAVEADGESVLLLTRAVGTLSEKDAACRPSQPDLTVGTCVEHDGLWVARDEFSTSVTIVREGRTVSAVFSDTAEAPERGARILRSLREATPAEVEAAVRHRIAVESPVDPNRGGRA